MNLDKNLPSKKKLFVYIGALVLVCGAAAYIYSSNAEKKSGKERTASTINSAVKGINEQRP